MSENDVNMTKAVYQGTPEWEVWLLMVKDPTAEALGKLANQVSLADLIKKAIGEQE